VRGDLRAHHAGAEYGGFAYDEITQAVLLLLSGSESESESLSLAGSTPKQRCTRNLNERLNYMLFKAKVKKKCEKKTAPSWAPLI
jgi:hypothetical protein